MNEFLREEADPVQKKTQKERILEFIKEYGSIDRLNAYTELGIFELPARISELTKEDGVEFDKELKRGISKRGYGFNYMEYRLKQKQSLMQ